MPNITSDTKQQIIITSNVAPTGPQGPQGVPGVAGTVGASGGQVKARKVPNESPNGIRVTFTLPDAVIIAGSLTVVLNGLVEPVTESTNTFTFIDAPINSDVILCSYQVL